MTLLFFIWITAVEIPTTTYVEEGVVVDRDFYPATRRCAVVPVRTGSATAVVTDCRRTKERWVIFVERCSYLTTYARAVQSLTGDSCWWVKEEVDVDEDEWAKHPIGSQLGGYTIQRMRQR